MKATTLALMTTALWTTPAAAQLASYTFSGQSCGLQQHIFSAGRLPILGATFNVIVYSGFTSATSSGVTVIVTGTSNTSAGGLPLPFNVSVLSRGLTTWCGSLYTSIDLVTPTPTVRGLPRIVSLPLAIPNIPRLRGFRFYQQSVRLTTTSLGSAVVSFSRLGSGVLGY